MSTILIPVLVFIAVAAIGAALVGFFASKKNPLKERLRTLGGGSEQIEAERGGASNPMHRTLERVGLAVTKGGTASKKLREELAKAGFTGPNAVGIYLGAKMFLMLGGLIGSVIIVSLIDVDFAQGILIAMMGAGVLFFVPNIIVSYARKSRSEAIRNALPDAIDLLEICVSGGMALDMAWNSVAEDFRGISDQLADEMALTNLEMRLGANRGDAMRHMAERTGAEEISSLVAVLVQAERFGTSIVDALRVFATNMRELRSQRAEEAAEKMALKMLLPLAVLIFPVVLIVAVGPAVIILVDVLGR